MRTSPIAAQSASLSAIGFSSRMWSARRRPPRPHEPHAPTHARTHTCVCVSVYTQMHWVTGMLHGEHVCALTHARGAYARSLTCTASMCTDSMYALRVHDCRSAQRRRAKATAGARWCWSCVQTMTQSAIRGPPAAGSRANIASQDSKAVGRAGTGRAAEGAGGQQPVRGASLMQPVHSSHAAGA